MKKIVVQSKTARSPRQIAYLRPLFNRNIHILLVAAAVLSSGWDWIRWMTCFPPRIMLIVRTYYVDTFIPPHSVTCYLLPAHDLLLLACVRRILFQINKYVLSIKYLSTINLLAQLCARVSCMCPFSFEIAQFLSTPVRSLSAVSDNK